MNSSVVASCALLMPPTGLTTYSFEARSTEGLMELLASRTTSKSGERFQEENKSLKATRKRMMGNERYTEVY